MEQAPHIVDAIRQVNSGQFIQAREALQNAIKNNPDDVTAIMLLVEVEDRLGNKLDAATLLDGLIERSRPIASLLFRRGLIALGWDHQQLSKANEAAAFFARAKDADPGMATAHLYLGFALKRQTWQVEGIPHYRRATLLQPDLIEAVHELGRSLFLAEDAPGARRHFEHVLVMFPGHESVTKDLGDLNELLRDTTTRRRGVRFPNNLDDFQDVKHALTTHVLSASYPNILSAETKVATFGSCFAGNIARALREAGVNAANTTMGESVNSTFANRHYIDWVVNRADNKITRGIVDFHAGDVTFSANIEDHRRSLSESNIVVMTVGVAPVFFRLDTGEFAMPRQSGVSLRAMLKECESRMTTVDENADNIRFIIAQIRKINPTCTVVVTISPVPLNTTLEYDSAVVADCVSKSTLRVAVDQVMRDGVDRLIYWPSFEVVRWLGAYSPGMYGEDDGSTIHVSERAIALIVDAFIDKLSAGALTSPPRAARAV